MPKSKRHSKRRNKKQFHTSKGGSTRNKRLRNGLNTPINPIKRNSKEGFALRRVNKLSRKRRFLPATGYPILLNHENK